MKYGHTVKKDGILYPADVNVPVGAPTNVELTDNVPDDALDTNADGSVNSYDESGKFAGTVDAEAVEKLQEEAGESFNEQEKPKRSRKPKED